MTDRAALLMDLADRVEKAEGADRELDLGIARAIGWEQDPKQPQLWRHTSTPNVRQMFEPPRYTASLDAALSLVPDKCGFLVMGNASKVGRHPSRGATPALALCAASLGALASEARDE